MKNLLYAGVVGPLLFIVVFLVEGATRPGYSAWRRYVSQLATGPGGWMQVANFLVCGSLVVLCAIALRVSLRGQRGAVGGPLLVGLFATALLVAGVFSTDPALGYAPGAAAVHTPHGLIHGLAGLMAFTTLPATAFVMAWHFAAKPERRWVIYSAAVGALMLLLFVAAKRDSDPGHARHVAERPDRLSTAHRDHHRLDVDRDGGRASTPRRASSFGVS